MSGRAKAFVAGACGACFILWMFGPREPLLWGILALAAGIGAAVLWAPRSWLSGGRGFLCDRCKYDSERDCSHPERPNARKCDDFKPRGS